MNVEHIHWLGHASFRIEDQSRQIYIDPWKLPPNQPKADIILITHSHYDHHSPDDLARIIQPGTILVGPADVMSSHPGQGFVVKPGETKTIANLTLVTWPAYNLSKSFHPKAKGWVGYNLLLSTGQQIYHTGDTDFVPEMNTVKTEVLLIPIGGTYTMDAEVAALACNTIQPQVAIPMHWGDIVGSANDVQNFRKLVRTTVVVKNPER
ncbi:MBL fold metallo-hydrolase [candidate division KSB1 bacterium]|nr:MBL fold metallo-hydrolase [candidate division KSB1 bacterium]